MALVKSGLRILAFGARKKKKGERNTFIPNASRLPKLHCFLEGFQASPVCPSGKSNT
jgi:hypothetical protein